MPGNAYVRWALFIIALFIALVVILIFSGCGSDQDEQLDTDFPSVTDHIKYGHRHDGQDVREDVIQYRGNTLYCLDFEGGSHGAHSGVSCDWVRYHQEADQR